MTHKSRGVDFHADLSFFGIGADRIEVEHIQVQNPHEYEGPKATVAQVTVRLAGMDETLVELDERTAIAFAEALLDGFDHPGVHCNPHPLLPLEQQVATLDEVLSRIGLMSIHPDNVKVIEELGHLGYTIAKKT